MLRSASITAAALAALLLTACGNGDDAAPAASGGEATTSIELVGTDSLGWDVEAVTVPAGEEITVELISEEGVEHDFVIEDVDGQDLEVAHADPGETATGTFTLEEPGSYTFYCSIPGHRQAGMEGTITVTDAA